MFSFHILLKNIYKYFLQFLKHLKYIQVNSKFIPFFFIF